MNIPYIITNNSITVVINGKSHTLNDGHPNYAAVRQAVIDRKFDKIERKVRNIINTFCGQSFDYYPNKYIEMSGSGKKSMHLPIPISTLTKVTANVGDSDQTVLHDSTDATLNNIEKAKELFNKHLQ